MIDVETESEYTMEESLIDVINPAISVRLGDIGFPPSYQYERWKKREPTSFRVENQETDYIMKNGFLLSK